MATGRMFGFHHGKADHYGKSWLRRVLEANPGPARDEIVALVQQASGVPLPYDFQVSQSGPPVRKMEMRELTPASSTAAPGDAPGHRAGQPGGGAAPPR